MAAGTSTDWMTLALTTLGGGAVGSIVATYTSQTRERRQVRADAREAIAGANKFAFVKSSDKFSDAAEILETKAMLAGMPRNLVILYRNSISTAFYCESRSGLLDNEGGFDITSAEGAEALALVQAGVTAWKISFEARKLFVDATWHPWLLAPWCWYRGRRLMLMLEGVSPAKMKIGPEARKITRSEQRKFIKLGKRARKKG